MSRVMDTVRRVVGSGATAPAGPAPIDLKAEYVQAVTGFIAAGRRYDRQGEVYHWRDRLHTIRRRAHEDGHDSPMEAVWIAPPEHLNTEVLDWYQAVTDHALRGGPAPGEKPLHPREPEFWLQRYRGLVADYLRGHRFGDRAAAGHASNLLGILPCEAATKLGDKINEVLPRFGPHPGFADDEDSLDAWECEVNHRLQHGASSGEYVPAQMPPPFRRMVDEQTHSPVVLLAPHGSDPLGARVRLNPAISCELVERGLATWCDPQNIPIDPRPPVECEPGPDWHKLTFLRQVRTRSRHVRQNGDVVALPPDEAEELVMLGAAEFWTAPLPPPPPPPRQVTVFGTANG
jgi:hypothetical protein